MAEHSHENHDSGGAGTGGWVFLGFILIAGYFLLTEHRAHVVQFLPFLLLLACPLLHVFHRHGRHGGGEQRGERDEKAGTAAIRDERSGP